MLPEAAPAAAGATGVRDLEEVGMASALVPMRSHQVPSFGRSAAQVTGGVVACLPVCYTR